MQSIRGLEMWYLRVRAQTKVKTAITEVPAQAVTSLLPFFVQSYSEFHASSQTLLTFRIPARPPAYIVNTIFGVSRQGISDEFTNTNGLLGDR